MRRFCCLYCSRLCKSSTQPFWQDPLVLRAAGQENQWEPTKCESFRSIRAATTNALALILSGFDPFHCWDNCNVENKFYIIQTLHRNKHSPRKPHPLYKGFRSWAKANDVIGCTCWIINQQHTKNNNHFQNDVRKMLLTFLTTVMSVCWKCFCTICYMTKVVAWSI